MRRPLLLVKYLTGVIAAIAFAAGFLASAALAQSLVLNLDKAQQALAEAGLGDTIIINGPAVRIGANTPLDDRDAINQMDLFALSLLALREIEKGTITLNDVVGHIIPDRYDIPPWRRALRVHHLLSGTAGFAHIPRDDWQNLQQRHHSALVLEARPAGAMAAFEPAGLYLLALLLEQAGGQSLAGLIDQHITTPLGLGPDDIGLKRGGLVPNLSFSNRALAAMVQLLVRNRSADGSAYLSTAGYAWLTSKTSWMALPTGPRRMLALAERSLGGARALTTPQHPPALPGGRPVTAPLILAFVDNNIALLLPAGTRAEDLLAPLGRAAPTLFARDTTAEWAATQAALAERLPQAGRYIRNAQPLMWLRHRLAMARDALVITPVEPGTLDLQQRGETTRFNRKAPFTYTSATGDRLLLNPASSARIIFNGVPHLSVGFAVHPLASMGVFLIASIAVLTALIYWRSSIDNRYRLMARFAAIGVLLTWAGVGLDLSYYPQLLYHAHWPSLIILWRLAMLVGIALVTSLPLFCLALARESELLPLKQRIAVQMHFLLLIIASLSFTAIQIAWGIAPDILPV